MLTLHFSSKKPLVISLIVLGVFVAGSMPSYYFYDKYQKSQQLLKNPTEAARQEVQTLKEKVSRHIELPNEEPTVATVSDKEKLKDQAFFAKAENGDKVLIYTQARKAILFRPASNKIIEVSTVNIGQASPEAMPAARGVAGTATASAAVSTTKLAIYNGTNTVGLAGVAEKQLKEKVANIEVVAKENAKRKDYEKTIVVALSQNKGQEAKAVAEFLGTLISQLPEGETKPHADILVVLGTDYTKR